MGITLAEYFKQIGKKEGIERGIEQGMIKGVNQTAKNLLQEGLPLSVIARATGLPKEVLESLQSK